MSTVQAVKESFQSLPRRTEVVKEGYDDSEAAAMFIDWVQEMNDYMNIPRHIPEIQESDIGVMAKHADAEANLCILFRSLWAKKNLQLCMRLSEDNEIGYRRISKKTERFF